MNLDISLSKIMEITMCSFDQAWELYCYLEQHPSTCDLYVEDNKYYCKNCDYPADPNEYYCACCGSRIRFSGESKCEVREK